MNSFSHYDAPAEPLPDRFAPHYPSANPLPVTPYLPGSENAAPYYRDVYAESLAHHFFRTVSWNWIAGLLVLGLVVWQNVNVIHSAWILYICVAVVLHELGHYVAMLCLGYRDPMTFVVPLFGWLTSGTDQFAPSYRRAAVYLLGPLPSMVLAVACAMVYRYVPFDWLFEFTWTMVLVNVLLALPVVPFDGNKILYHTLFSRNAVLEAGFTLACVGFILLGSLVLMRFVQHGWIIALFAAMLAYGLVDTFRLGRIADELRPFVPPHLTDQPPEMSFDLCRAIVDRVLTVKTTGSDPFNELRPKDAAPIVCDIWRRMIDEPPGMLLTIVYLGGLGFVLFFGPLMAGRLLMTEIRTVKADPTMPGKRVVEYHNVGKIEGRIGLNDKDRYHGPHTEWVVHPRFPHLVYVEGQWLDGYRDGQWTYYERPKWNEPPPERLEKVAIRKWQKGVLVEEVLLPGGVAYDFKKQREPLGIGRRSRQDKWREP